MAQIVRMPSVMANATDAVLSQWLTGPGETIAIGDPLAEIETDKAVVEYAAEVDGTIGRLLVEPGARVVVGDPIAVVLEEGEDPAATPLDISPSPDPAATSTDKPTPASTNTAESSTAAPPSQQPAGQLQVRANPTGRLFATPIARRIAAQRGVDLALLTGTGPNGRIVRKDVESYRAATTVPPANSDATSTDGGYRDVPLTGMRRAIAQRLTESKTTVPHFYVTAHVRTDRLLALRQEINVGVPHKISVTDFVVKAVAAAMLQVPAANAIWNEESIRYFESVDVAVAVALPNGLLTPVIRGVERLGLNELSTQIAQVADAARAGRLQQHQLEGGSFTVSNLGMYGVTEFSAIINPPQAGILAVSAAKQQPVVGKDGQIAVESVMTVTLSVDHRVIDGAVAADWIAALVACLENPARLLL
jgi:pyruvate dehydrogenase E2 component (dihydrolipoamide acetyltransferase)